MFGITTNQEMPQEYAECYDAWDGYMAKIWAQIFSFIGLSKKCSLLEFASGSSKKIIKALKIMDFNGEYIVVEPLEDLEFKLIKTSQELISDANFYLIKDRFSILSAKKINVTLDVICANHPFDDMVMGDLEQNLRKETKIFNWTKSPSGVVSEEYFDLWAFALKNPDILDNSKKRVISEFVSFIQHSPPKYIICNQYGSAALKKSGMENLNDLSKKVQDDIEQLCIQLGYKKTCIQSVLNQFNNFNNIYVGQEILNARNWIVLSKV